MGGSSSSSSTTTTNREYTFINDAAGGGDGGGESGAGSFNLNLAESSAGDVHIEAIDQGALETAGEIAFKSIDGQTEVAGKALEFGEFALGDVTDLVSRTEQRAAQTVDRAIAEVRQSNEAQATKVLETIGKYGALAVGAYAVVTVISKG